MSVRLAGPWDVSLARHKPFEHQIVGVQAILANPYLMLGDEMGLGKTKETIDGAQVLFKAGVVNRMIVVAPAAVCSVWMDPNFGQLAEHLWKSVNARITQYHARNRTWEWGDPTSTNKLHCIITNYEFVRAENRLEELLKYVHVKTLLVLDESSSVKNYKADQTKACLKLRQRAGRVLLLNGTPIANSPGDMFSQCYLMSPSILECKSFFYFRSRYAVMGGWQAKQIVGWTNLDDLQRRIAPYMLRRLKESCLDLPPKLPPVTITVPLSEASWKLYREMRDEMVAWLSDKDVSVANQAIVKIIRLGQITSGFLGGFEDAEITQEITQMPEERPDWLPSAQPLPQPEIVAPRASSQAVEVGREKLDAFLLWLGEQLMLDPGFKILVWCRWKPELERLLKELTKFKGLSIGALYGEQHKRDREYALRLLDPRTTPDGPVVVVGTQGTGSMGLNLTAAWNVFYLSQDYSLYKRKQSEDRVHRPGQTRAVSYFNMVATGPKGQKTIDHKVVRALENKENLAEFTASAWVAALTEE